MYFTNIDNTSEYEHYKLRIIHFFSGRYLHGPNVYDSKVIMGFKKKTQLSDQKNKYCQCVSLFRIARSYRIDKTGGKRTMIGGNAKTKCYLQCK